MERVENDAVVQDPAKVGEEGSRGGVLPGGDTRLQLADIYRIDNVVFVEGKLEHVDGVQERMRIGHRFDAIHGERQHVRQLVAAGALRLLGRVAHGNAFGARPVGAGGRLLLNASHVIRSWTMYAFYHLISH